MDPQSARRKACSAEEYLAIERLAEERHELIAGEILARPRGSRRHALIAANLVGGLGNPLRDRPCLVVGSHMRVAAATVGLYTYPDVVVVCGGAQFIDEGEDTLTNPGVIVEVLSPTTESYDRGKKFEQYRAIASLTDYVLVSQEALLVEHFVRQPGGAWLLTEHRAGDRLTFDSLGCSIPLAEIYLKVLA